MNKLLLSTILAIFIFASLTNGATSTFSDVNTFYPYKQAIQDLSDKAVITGYPDKTFKPYAITNRAEFLALAYRASGTTVGQKPTAFCFPDVAPTQWYAPYVCAAKTAGIVQGGPDGKFHPAEKITLTASAKIIVGLNSLKTAAATATQPWYKPYLEALSKENYLPPTFKWVGQEVTRGELAEMLWRVRGKFHDKEKVLAANLSATPCQLIGDDLDSRFDMQRVRNTWFGWINDARKKAGLSAYTENQQLDRTATDWAKTMRSRGVISHKRDPGDAYYNYAKITSWFADHGIVAKNIYRVTHTENIGGGYLQCTKTDCTDELIAAIRPTFDAYMREGSNTETTSGNGTSTRAHYNSVMNKYFQEIGMGVTVNADGKVFAATHYVTEIISGPVEMCK